MDIIDSDSVLAPPQFAGFPVANLPPLDIEIIKSFTGKSGKNPVPQLPSGQTKTAGYLKPLEPNELAEVNKTCWPSFDCNSETPFMPFEDPGSCIPLKSDISRYL
eukprot:TRINITY_DN74932_c0_g1_i1.p1 TRINITY_DN74932_c0_g1~~TRINITY_DN74932_c0_g1_i1.p1  ORF type:complete len:105 (-),score=11.72 TRINITY_DN74932_c0_g1_i1:138-452(-)